MSGLNHRKGKYFIYKLLQINYVKHLIGSPWFILLAENTQELVNSGVLRFRSAAVK